MRDHTKTACLICGECPDVTDPALSNDVCVYCGYWGVPVGPERTRIRDLRRQQRRPVGKTRSEPDPGDVPY